MTDEDLIAQARHSWAATTEKLLEAARSFDGDWDGPSDCGSWTNRELLAHLATGYIVRRSTLRAAIEGSPVPARVDIDEANARNIATLAAAPISETIGHMRRVREEISGLLANLRPEHLDLSTHLEAGTLRDALATFDDHDLEHAGQLRRS